MCCDYIYIYVLNVFIYLYYLSCLQPNNFFIDKGSKRPWKAYRAQNQWSYFYINWRTKWQWKVKWAGNQSKDFFIHRGTRWLWKILSGWKQLNILYIETQRHWKRRSTSRDDWLWGALQFLSGYSVIIFFYLYFL